MIHDIPKKERSSYPVNLIKQEITELGTEQTSSGPSKHTMSQTLHGCTPGRNSRRREEVGRGTC